MNSFVGGSLKLKGVHSIAQLSKKIAKKDESKKDKKKSKKKHHKRSRSSSSSRSDHKGVAERKPPMNSREIASEEAKKEESPGAGEEQYPMTESERRYMEVQRYRMHQRIEKKLE